jgi:CRISPR/Cas system CMR-associated protein Cmr5 small subunit
MDKETTILIIAQNGLKTAAIFFSTKSDKLGKQAEKSEDKAAKSKLMKKAAKAKKLAAILISADEGITAYLREKEIEEQNDVK